LLNKQSIKKVRKMKNKVLMGLAAIAMVAFLSSCGKVPQAKVDATNAAIAAAQTAEATVYVPAEFTAVQDSMNAINAAIEVQKSKLFKKFGPIEVKLDATLAAATKVASDAAAKKEEVKKEVETTIAAVKAVVVENGDLMKKAPRGKEGAAVLEAMKTDMTAIDATVAEAQAAYDKGSYMDALNKIKAANEKATGINTELKDAIAKVHGGKPAATPAAKPAAKPAVKK
jgi:ATP/maltotriose-dependent transcriptional regulator MalT